MIEVKGCTHEKTICKITQAKLSTSNIVDFMFKKYLVINWEMLKMSYDKGTTKLRNQLKHLQNGTQPMWK